MWDQQETRREPLPDGTALCTENGRFTIQKYITSGGFALLYQAQEEGQSSPESEKTADSALSHQPEISG